MNSSQLNSVAHLPSLQDILKGDLGSLQSQSAGKVEPQEAQTSS